MFRKLIFFLIGIFLISFISSQTTNEYQQVDYGRYKVLSQDNVEQAYQVKFSEPDKNGTIQISACVQNETTELIDLKVDKEWYEKVIDKISFWDTYEDYKYINYTYVTPLDLKIELEPNAKQNYLLERQVDIKTNEICFKYSANPYEIPYIKLGDNSIIIIQDSQWISTSNLINVTAEGGKSNHTHLNISNTAPWDSLVGYWSFDGDLENTALTTAYDWSKYNNDGTYVGDVVSNSTGGVYGEGLVLDGTGDYVGLTIMPELAVTKDYTISGWVKTGINSNTLIMSQNDGSSRLSWTAISSTAISFGHYNGTSYYFTSSNVLAGIWTHITCIHLANQTNRIYVNGVLGTGTSDGRNPGSSYGITLGSSPTGVNYYYNGSIDDVMIFNTSLTPAQILEIYNNQSARFLENGRQDIHNQSYMNISSGNNKVNVSTQIENNMGSQINLSVGYYDGSWSATAPQTISSLTNYTFDISSTSTNLTLNYTFIAGNSTTSFYSPLIKGNILFEAWSSEVSDTTAPTYSLNQTNSTIAGQSALFSLYWNDNTALHPLGQYIFSTNNTGVWANESAVNFTATPEWANVSKILNSTVGISVGFRWYANDTAGNWNVSEVFSLLTTTANTCTCAGLNNNWEVNLGDYCVIVDNCDLGTGKLSFTGTGNFTCDARIDTTNLGDVGNNNIFWVNSNCEVYIS